MSSKNNSYSTIFIVQPDVRARAEAKPIGTNQGMKYSVQRTNWVEGERKGPSNRNSHSELRIVGRTGGTHPEPPQKYTLKIQIPLPQLTHSGFASRTRRHFTQLCIATSKFINPLKKILESPFKYDFIVLKAPVTHIFEAFH